MLVVGAVAGLIFVFLTPPFEVPDETAHYWRACAIARGVLQPLSRGGQGYTAIPMGERELGIAGAAPVRETWSRMRKDWAIPAVSERVFVRYPLSLSPLPFLPQAAGIAAGNLFHLRPMLAFYCGRLASLAVCLALAALAMRAFAGTRFIIAVCLLFPMTLFMFASFSPDGITIAVTFLTISLALSGSAWVIAAALALAFCKPYLLVPLLALAPARKTDRFRHWRFPWAPFARSIAIVGIVAGGALVARSFAQTSMAFMRAGVDEKAQRANIVTHPLETLSVIASDVGRHGLDYAKQMIGTLGWLSVPLPTAVLAAVAALLAIVVIFAGPRLTSMQRILAGFVALGSIAAIEIAEYIAWTAVGARTIDGVQGRYFIPIAPLILVALSRPSDPPRWLTGVLGAVMAIANAVAVYELWHHYFGF